MEFSVSLLSPEHNFSVVGVSYVGAPKNRTAMYITKKVEHLLTNLKNASQCLIFAEDTIEPPEKLRRNHCFILSANPQQQYTDFVNQFANLTERKNRTRKYTLTEGGYYVGENVKIGENAYIEPGCLIGHDVIIGDNAKIFAGAKIKNTTIGNDFIAGENCTIGTYGFTMTLDANGNRMRIPSLGKIVIGDHVEVGAHTNICTSSGGDTVLKNWVKLDALVHVGHDAMLENNVEVTAGVIVGGFDQLKEKTYVGLNTTLRNRISVGENALIGMGAAVIRDVPSSTVVVGNPAKKLEKSDK